MFSHARIVKAAFIICYIPTSNDNTPIFATCFISKLDITLSVYRSCQSKLIGLWNSWWRLRRRCFFFQQAIPSIVKARNFAINLCNDFWLAAKLSEIMDVFFLFSSTASERSAKTERKPNSSNMIFAYKVSSLRWPGVNLTNPFLQFRIEYVETPFDVTFFSVNGLNWLVDKPR